MVDWSGASVTPKGFSVTVETLEPTLVIEAAHRTSPGKDAGGTEIIRSPCKVAFYAVDIIFFQQHEESARELADSLVQLINLIGSGKKFSILAHFDLRHLLFEKLPLNDLVLCRLKY